MFPTTASFVQTAALTFSAYGTQAIASTNVDSTGVWNRGSPLYVPSGIPVEFARPPQIHRLPAKVESAAIVKNTPPASTDSDSATSSTNGVLNVQAPLFIPPTAKIPTHRPNPHIQTHRQFAAPPKPQPLTPPPSPPVDKSAYNGHINIPTKLFTPSESDLKKVEEEREKVFWATYWDRERKRQQRLEASIFPRPIPKSKTPVETPFVRPTPVNTVFERIHRMEKLIAEMVEFIGI